MKKVVALIMLAAVVTDACAAGRIAPELWNTVVKLAVFTNGAKLPLIGTGFIVGQEIERSGVKMKMEYLVTCKHVISDWTPDHPHISNYVDRVLVSYYTDDLQPAELPFDMVKKAADVFLLPHPKAEVDIVAIVLANELVLKSNYKVGVLDKSYLLAFTNQQYIGYADSVFALGYPRGITSRRNNYPIAKHGAISSIPGEEFSIELAPVTNRVGIVVKPLIEGKFYVVDGLIVGGNSGGPVVVPSDIRLSSGTNGLRARTRPTPNYVIGLVSSTFTTAGLAVVHSSDYIQDILREHEKRFVVGSDGKFFLQRGRRSGESLGPSLP